MQKLQFRDRTVREIDKGDILDTASGKIVFMWAEPSDFRIVGIPYGDPERRLKRYIYRSSNLYDIIGHDESYLKKSKL